MATTIDFLLSDHNSIWILTPISVASQEWADEHLPEDVQTWGAGLVVEWRYIETIVTAIVAAGLNVRSIASFRPCE